MLSNLGFCPGCFEYYGNSGLCTIPLKHINYFVVAQTILEELIHTTNSFSCAVAQISDSLISPWSLFHACEGQVLGVDLCSVIHKILVPPVWRSPFWGTTSLSSG